MKFRANSLPIATKGTPDARTWARPIILTSARQIPERPPRRIRREYMSIYHPSCSAIKKLRGAPTRDHALVLHSTTCYRPTYVIINNKVSGRSRHSSSVTMQAALALCAGAGGGCSAQWA
ncbi:hypothetical protein EVAR_89883_1 [Eumeta japonica]|uniref:Uncharacterized protein n=1 Tax=Eumeta variegata TaxID=151549 RepID=A0A4C1YYN1_EUMVA|nr:hypothetical protein EVAR_89883_1 [Eumeta japonica]